jgi:Cu+-exporting ATPase
MSGHEKAAGLPILPAQPRQQDPVCGMMVGPQQAARKMEHRGKTYYFCSARCAERFEKEPEKFLASPGRAGMERAPALGAEAKQSRYTCPMHPEIVRIGPGNSPICGMALEPMAVSAEA